MAKSFDQDLRVTSGKLRFIRLHLLMKRQYVNCSGRSPLPTQRTDGNQAAGGSFVGSAVGASCTIGGVVGAGAGSVGAPTRVSSALIAVRSSVESCAISSSAFIS